MAGWLEEVRELVASLGSRLGRGAGALERLVDRDPYHVVGYRGYAGEGRALVLGRVLEHEGLATPEPSHSKLRNLLAMLKRLESDPLPFARVQAQVAGREFELTADDEGFIREWVDVGGPQQEGWGSVQLELLNLRTNESPEPRRLSWFHPRLPPSGSSATWMTPSSNRKSPVSCGPRAWCSWKTPVLASRFPGSPRSTGLWSKG